MLILGAALGGAIVSGLLLLISDYFRSKREESREQRNFERDIFTATLAPIKTLIDEGIAIVTTFALLNTPEHPPIGQAEYEATKQYLFAINRATITAKTLDEKELEDNLVRLQQVAQKVADAIASSNPLNLIAQTQEILADIEIQYINLTVEFRPTQNPPWWW